MKMQCVLLLWWLWWLWGLAGWLRGCRGAADADALAMLEASPAEETIILQLLAQGSDNATSESSPHPGAVCDVPVQPAKNNSAKSAASDVVQNSGSMERGVRVAGGEAVNADDFSGVRSVLPDKMFSVHPPFDMGEVEGVSEKCRGENDIYMRNLKAHKLWALKMYDATAKVTTGLLNGNVHQYGDFDQCLEVDAALRGQYCLTSFQFSIASNASRQLRILYDLTHAHHSLRSNLEDPGHRVPRFSSVLWGICVPQGCSATDVEVAARHLVKRALGDEVTVRVRVESSMCQHNTPREIRTDSILAGMFFLGIIGITIFGTIYDGVTRPMKSEYAACFSLRKNVQKLFSLERRADDIQAVHGIRFINAIMLLVGHKSFTFYYGALINRTTMSEAMGKPWSVIGRGSCLYTDPFIMFSALLTSHGILKRKGRGQSISIFKEYLGRLFRLIPTMGALIIFCTLILPGMGAGPQWPLVVGHHATICRQYWWRNLMFIQNYFGFENLCLNHTHHIGIDTQLFAVGVLLSLWLAWRQRQALLVIVTLGIVSTFARFIVSYQKNLALYVYYGTTVRQLFDTADSMYILPSHRFTVYALGLFLGIMLYKSPKVRLTERQTHIGWVISFSLFLGSLLSPVMMGVQGYRYNSLHQAGFAAFTPICWCLSFMWLIYTAHHNYPSKFAWLGDLFSWKGFLVWTRLSYAVYLTQFPVFFYTVGAQRSSEYFTLFGSLINFREIVWILFFSIVLTLLFDMPFQNIKNILFRQKKVARTSTQTENSSLANGSVANSEKPHSRNIKTE